MRKIKLHDVFLNDWVDLADLFSRTMVMQRDIFNKLIKNQKHLSITCAAITGLVAVQAYQRKKLEEQIYNLSVRVKKLENCEDEE